ncbi:MAG: hypothetical protein HRU34_21850 [Richelia sp.]|nr:hypothetical protein [Richelia sp.]
MQYGQCTVEHLNSSLYYATPPTSVPGTGEAPPVPPQRALAFALDNQDILHNYVQQSVSFTTKLDALTLN